MDVSIDPILGRMPSGVFILTMGTGPRSTGILVSWVMQAGFDPPTVTVAVRKGRAIGDRLTEGEPFVLNLIGQSHKALIQHFSRGFQPEDETVFKGLQISHCPRGVPILDDTIGHLECQTLRHVDSEDHRIFVVKVVRGRLASGDPPFVHIRKSGSHY